jgi:hypothetical protein
MVLENGFLTKRVKPCLGDKYLIIIVKASVFRDVPT